MNIEIEVEALDNGYVVSIFDGKYACSTALDVGSLIAEELNGVASREFQAAVLEAFSEEPTQEPEPQPTEIKVKPENDFSGAAEMVSATIEEIRKATGINNPTLGDLSDYEKLSVRVAQPNGSADADPS